MTALLVVMIGLLIVCGTQMLADFRRKHQLVDRVLGLEEALAECRSRKLAVEAECREAGRFVADMERRLAAAERYAERLRVNLDRAEQVGEKYQYLTARSVDDEARRPGSQIGPLLEKVVIRAAGLSAESLFANPNPVWAAVSEATVTSKHVTRPIKATEIRVSVFVALGDLCPPELVAAGLGREVELEVLRKWRGQSILLEGVL